MQTSLQGQPVLHFLTSIQKYKKVRIKNARPANKKIKDTDHMFLLRGINPPSLDPPQSLVPIAINMSPQIIHLRHLSL
jgi:hypothetical protein